MQKPSEKKRNDIVAVATRLFATRPFHQVRLEDIASRARIGKGTIYIYFKSKEDLYASIVREGFSAMISRLEQRLSAGQFSPREALRLVIREQVEFAMNQKWIYQLLRVVRANPEQDKNVAKRAELARLISSVIVAGTKSGDFADPHPELTALYIPAIVHGTMMYAPEHISAETIAEHAFAVLTAGLCVPGKKIKK